MDKLDPKTDGASKDITAENIEALKRLFPECVTEGKVDFDVLRETARRRDRRSARAVQLHLERQEPARRIAQTPSTGTLRPCPEESVNWDTTQNIFIEGDNLEVLKLLQKSYHKQGEDDLYRSAVQHGQGVHLSRQVPGQPGNIPPIHRPN